MEECKWSQYQTPRGGEGGYLVLRLVCKLTYNAASMTRLGYKVERSPTLRSLKDTFKCVRVVLSDAKSGRRGRKWAFRLSSLPPSIMLSRTATSAGDIRGWWLASGNRKDEHRDGFMESI